MKRRIRLQIPINNNVPQCGSLVKSINIITQLTIPNIRLSDDIQRVIIYCFHDFQLINT